MAQPLLPLPEVTELNGIKALPTRAAIAGQRIGPTIRSAVSGARRLGVVGAAAGTAASLGDYKLDDPEVDSSAMGTIRAVRGGDFDMARRSLGKGALEAGMDLGSAAAQTLDMVVPGTNTVSRAYGNMLRDKFGPQLIDNSGTMGSGGAGRGFVNPPLPSAAPENAPPTATPTDVSRPAFSDARMTAQSPALMNAIGSSGPYAKAPPTGNAPGTFRYADGSTGKGTVSSLDTIGVEGYQRQLANIRSLGGPGSGDGQPLNQSAGGFGGGVFGFRPASAEAPSLDTRGLSAQQAAALRMQQADLAERSRATDVGAATSRYSTDVGSNTAIRGQDVGAATSRYGTDVGANTAIRGQDMSLMASRAANKLATFNALREQSNRDREFGQSQQRDDLAARSSSQKDFDEQLGQRFRTRDDKGNDVVDHGKVASYKAALQTTVPAFVDLLKRTNTPEAQAKAAELEKRGVSALGPDDHAQLQQLFDTRELARQTHGALPGKSSYVHSDNLLDFKQNTQAPVARGLTGRRVQTANGTSVDLDKLRYGADANTILPNFTPQNMNLTRGIRQEY